MSDELADFFAKKAQKSKDRKKKVNVGEIAEHLERSARFQERSDRDELEKQQEPAAPTAVVDNEDSEWIENPEEDLTKLEEYGITRMDVSELNEEEEVEEEKVEAEPARTWNFDQNGVNAQKESERAEEIAPQVKAPKKYVPPVNRFGGGRRIAQPKIDLKNEEMFPSIENADKIEKELIKNEAKKSDGQNDGWKVQRESEKSGVYRPPTSKNVYRPPSQREAPAATTTAPPTANKYVPPNRRNQNPW